MTKPTKHHKLVITKKAQIQMLLNSLRREQEQEQPPERPDYRAYNEYRWLIKAEEETDGQQTPKN